MLGRRIDRAALPLLAAAALYPFFLNAWRSIPLACAATFACVMLIRRLLGRPRRGLNRTAARTELLRIAALPDAEAADVLRELIEARYPGEVFALFPALKHPETSLSSGDVLAAWKANRGAARLVIAATCPCEPRAACYARQLADPEVAVVDSRLLLRLLGRRASPVTEPRAVPLRRRLAGWFAFAASRPIQPRNLLLAAVMLAVYRLNGNPMYLFAALPLLLQLAAALRHRRFRRTLFDR
ncbi:MAG: hypothetical protein Q4C10_03415 [Clostridia bacterium]|nr:hypothetical protein [Clostridia bacterium]